MKYTDYLKKQGMYYHTIETTEYSLIKETLEITFGNQLKAAKILGINRNTLRSKMRKLGIKADKNKVR